MGDSKDTIYEALNEAVETHSGVLFRIAQRIVRDPAVAEDMCQNALLKAWQEHERIETKSALKSWLNRVTVNESLQWLRRQKLEKAYKTDPQNDRTPNRTGVEETLANREALLGALDELPEQTRNVVVFRIVHGYSGREVADMLAMSDVQVSRALHRGLKLMNETLGEEPCFNESKVSP